MVYLFYLKVITKSAKGLHQLLSCTIRTYGRYNGCQHIKPISILTELFLIAMFYWLALDSPYSF